MTLRHWLRSTGIAALIATVVLLVLVVVASSGGEDADLSYRTADYDVSIAKNGDMTIVQHLDIRLKDRGDDDTARPWKQLYQQYTIDPSNLTAITDVSVTNVSTGEHYGQITPQTPSSVDTGQWNTNFARHWYIADVSQGANSPQAYDATGADAQQSGKRTVEVGWNIPATTQADHLRFDIAMTFTGVATAYDDVASLQWEPIGVTNQIPIGQVTGTVRFPEGVNTKNSWAWLHFSGRSTTSRSSDGTLHFTASDVRNGQHLNVVAMFDVHQSAGIARRAPGNAAQRIKDDEASQEQAWRDQQQQRARLIVVLAVVVALVGLLIVVLGLIASIRSNRDAQYHGDIEYWRDPLNMSPASAASLLSVMQPIAAKQLTSRQMAATVLSLASKKAIAIYPGPVSQYHGINVLGASPQELSQSVGRSATSAKAAASTSTIAMLPIVQRDRGSLQLSASEDGALRLLESAAERTGSPVFDLDQMREAFSGWQDGYLLQERYQAGVSDEFTRLGATKSTGTVARVFGVVGVLEAVAAALGYLAVGQLALACVLGGPILFGSCLALVSARSVSLSERGQQLAGEVLGLKRYLEHFSDFTDRNSDDLVLWDRYLVYAVSFGISGEVLRQMAKAYPQLADPQWLDAYAGNSMLYWLYRPYLFGWSGGMAAAAPGSAQAAAAGALSANVGDIGAQLSSSFADLSQTIQMASPSATSDSASSGMFSGGGFGGMSGGSGGGSFGGR